VKLGPREAPGYFARPDPRRAGLLIYGSDAMRVALRRQEVVAALTGPQAEAEMRITRIAAADLRRDPALLLDAVKSVSFFPGPRAAVLEDAGDGLAGAVGAALDDWREGDATLVITAGSLGKSSALRKLFETHPTAYAAAIYDDPPSRDEVEARLTTAGITAVSPDGMSAILALSRALDPGDFRQTIEKLALYKLNDTSQATPEDVAAISPATVDADLDEVLNIVAEARTVEIGPIMRRIEGQGVTAVSLCIGATRHFRTLLAAAADPGGPAQGVSRLRPPVFGPRRDRIVRQAGSWGRPRLEQALALLIDTDLTLRSSSRAPDMAVMERALIRLAMMGRG
jgi:DNA polymerase-3 subunit delta